MPIDEDLLDEIFDDPKGFVWPTPITQSYATNMKPGDENIPVVTFEEHKAANSRMRERARAKRYREKRIATETPQQAEERRAKILERVRRHREKKRAERNPEK